MKVNGIETQDLAQYTFGGDVTEWPQVTMYHPIQMDVKDDKLMQILQRLQYLLTPSSIKRDLMVLYIKTLIIFQTILPYKRVRFSATSQRLLRIRVEFSGVSAIWRNQVSGAPDGLNIMASLEQKL